MIYFIEAVEVGKIKIGYCGFRVEGRFEGFQVGSPVSLRRLALMAGGHWDEKDVHAEFAHLRARGEWFRDDPSLREFILEYATPWVRGESDQFEPVLPDGQLLDTVALFRRFYRRDHRFPAHLVRKSLSEMH